MRKQLAALWLCISICACCSADNWMASLPDDMLACRVSIPGTHDSATGNGFDSGLINQLGTVYAQSQDLSLAEQWAAGVRAFDLRPATRDGYLQINHGIVATSVLMEEALLLLRDSLIENPTEFVVVHMRHESEGDEIDDVYESLLLELLASSEIAEYLADFSKDLTVGDLRGKILLTSRDTYADTPVGAFINGWTSNIDWSAQTSGKLVGKSSSTPLYMQDYYDTSDDGGVDLKIEAINTLLDATATHSGDDRFWVYNFASAYSKTTSLFGYTLTLSDGYRDNATYTNAAIIEYAASHDPAPMGIIMMDYAGIDTSDDYETRGQELVDTIIAQNFKYLSSLAGVTSTAATTTQVEQVYSLAGLPLKEPGEGINIVRYKDGTVKKTIR